MTITHHLTTTINLYQQTGMDSHLYMGATLPRTGDPNGY